MASFMKKMNERNSALREKIVEKLGKESTLYMGDPALNWGMGGWIRGRCNLIYGPSGSGKTALALIAAALEQKKTGGWVVIYDSEYSHAGPLNPDEEKALARYRKAGLDTDKILVIQSNEVDVLFGDLKSFEEDVRSGDLNVSAVVVDSWGGVQPEGARKKIDEGEVAAAGNAFGGNAKTMGPILQSLLRISAENGATMFFVQHCINNMEQYGPKYILVGGQKLRFLVHGILFVESVTSKDSHLLANGVVSKTHDEAFDRVGKKIRFRCEKSREVVEGRKGEFFMDFNELVFALPEVSLFNLATALGVIGHPSVMETETSGKNKGQPKLDKEGKPVYKTNKMYWEFPAGAPNASKFHGEAKTIEALKNDQNLFNLVREACMKSKTNSALTDDVKLGEEAGLGTFDEWEKTND